MVSLVVSSKHWTPIPNTSFIISSRKYEGIYSNLLYIASFTLIPNVDKESIEKEIHRPTFFGNICKNCQQNISKLSLAIYEKKNTTAKWGLLQECKAGSYLKINVIHHY